MLDAFQLQSMQDTQEASFPDRVRISRIVRTADGKGGFTTGTNSVIHDEVPASITPAQQLAMGGQADRSLEVEKWTVRMPWGTTVQDGDLIYWNVEDISLQVEDAKVSKTRGTAVTCMAEKVKGGSF